MKVFFKLFLLGALLVCVCSQAYTQTQRRLFTSDIHLGLNFAQMDIKDANMYKDIKLGMQIGVNFNYKVLGNMQVQTGIFVTKRGLKQHIDRYEVNTASEVAYRGDTILNTAADYLQVPLCVGYEVYLTKYFAVNFNAGLYLAYGFKGKHREEGYVETIKDGKVTSIAVTLPFEETNTFDRKGWKRFDYGGIAKIGFVYDIYTINLGYEYGLYNISDDGRRELKNRNLFASLGFRF